MNPQDLNDWSAASYTPDMPAEIDDKIEAAFRRICPEVSDAAPNDSELFWHILGMAMNKIDAWQIGALESYESIGRRVVARVCDMSPELVEGRGQSDLVAQLGGERASLSYWKKDFEKHFGVHFRPGKTLHACRSYAAARQQKVREKKEQTEKQRQSLAALLKTHPPKIKSQGGKMKEGNLF